MTQVADPLRVEISGKILDVSKGANAVVTIIAMPAPDEFTMPPAVSVRSQVVIGVVGDIVKVPARVGGYRRSFVDKGGARRVAADVTLDHCA